MSLILAAAKELSLDIAVVAIFFFFLKLLEHFLVKASLGGKDISALACFAQHGSTLISTHTDWNRLAITNWFKK